MFFSGRINCHRNHKNSTYGLEIDALNDVAYDFLTVVNQ
jgi:hypothetical protein